MAILSVFVEALQREVVLQLGVGLIISLAYPLYNLIYNLYLHPLARRFPGPKLWAASRLPFIFALLTGQLIKKQREFHEKYGSKVRIAPDEISFADEESWNEIYAFRKGHRRALRDKTFLTNPLETEVDDIITTNNPRFHGRVRGLLSNSFTKDALRSQYPIINHHADTLVSQLKSIARKPLPGEPAAFVNITDWVNFFTMDVIGDLAFGKPFGCLAQGEYHDWVRTLFSFLKYMSIAAAPRYYPLLEAIMMKLIPKRVLAGVQAHQKYAYDKIYNRLDSSSTRPDFMSAFLKRNPNFQEMSRKEIAATFNFVIIGGAETSATALTGIFTHIATNEQIRQRLSKELRSRFKNEEDIAIDELEELPYLNAVLNEGLRLCNPVPSGLPRVVPPGGDTYCGEFLPEGTRIGTRTFAINRSTTYFHDPLKFAPERWLPIEERPAEFANDQLTASKPFSVGFHSCLGKPLAWVELRLVIARLLWAFDIWADPGNETRFDDFPIIMMVQKGAVKLRIRMRDDSDAAEENEKLESLENIVE